MSAHVEELGRNGGEEDASQRRDASLNLRAVRPRTRNPLGEPSSVDFLVRPALPGRKTHRSWSNEAVRGRQVGTTEQDEARGANSEGDLEPTNMADLAEGSSSRYTNNGRRTRDENRQSTQMQATETLSSSSPEDPFWVEVWSGTARASQAVMEVRNRGNEEEDAGEGGSGVQEVQGQTSELLLPTVGSVERRMSKREKNRMRCLRRRQRKRERWRQLQESQESSTADPSSSSSEEDEDLIREGYICAVCLDVYFCPYMCHPCNHIFCEPCLRTLAKNSPTNTPCPLCRTIITHVFFQKELNQTARTFFPKEYLSRKQNFQKATCAKWPLPSCRKLFRIFGGFQRPSSPMARRRFPHFMMDFEDETPPGWRLDMDMVIIYIYSVNWIIGFFIFCFLCYLFFPSM